MIRKENVDIKEMNRKMISKATIKPNLNAFPIKDISVPFNSTRNTPGLREMALEKPVSFLDNNLGIAQQIEEIRNRRNQKNAINFNNANIVNNSLNISANNNVRANNNGENLELRVSNLENEPVTFSPSETFDKVKDILINIQNEINREDELEERKKPKKNVIKLPPGVSIPRPPSDEEMERNSRVPKLKQQNNLIRSIMDIKRDSNISKHMVILFFIVMAILIYSGQHRRLLR